MPCEHLDTKPPDLVLITSILEENINFTGRILWKRSQTKIWILKTYVEKRQIAFEKLYQEVQEKIKVTRARNQRRYNLRRRPVEYIPGQEVWRRNKSLSDAVNYYSAKLAPTYIGPFIIKRKTGSCTYELQDQAGLNKGIWHVKDLKPCNPSIETESSNNEYIFSSL